MFQKSFANRGKDFQLFRIQDVCLIFSLIIVFLSFFSTYVFQVIMIMMSIATDIFHQESDQALYLTSRLVNTSHGALQQQEMKARIFPIVNQFWLLPFNCVYSFATAHPWSTLVEGGKEQYRPPGILTLELVLANQKNKLLC